MLEVVLTIPFWFELAATITGAISGSMSASRARMDLFGTVVIATILGLFGGVMRDVLLQDYGIYAFQKPELIVSCAITALVVFYFGQLITFLDKVIDIIDGISVGLWAVVSVGKALSAGLSIVPAVIMGTITAVGGGIIRDIIMNKPVSAFQPGSPYGSAAMIGSIAFALMKTYHIFDGFSAILCVIIIVAIRFSAVAFGWRTKPSRDLSEPMADAILKPVRALKVKRKDGGQAIKTGQFARIDAKKIAKEKKKR